MNHIAQACPLPSLSTDLLEFAAQQEAGPYLQSVLEMTERIFHDRPLTVFLADDPEIANDRQTIIDVAGNRRGEKPSVRFSRAVGMPIGLPAFSWMVRVGARWLLRTDPELALFGRYVVSKRLKEEQFEFKFSQLGEALNDLLARSRDGSWNAS